MGRGRKGRGLGLVSKTIMLLTGAALIASCNGTAKGTQGTQNLCVDSTFSLAVATTYSLPPGIEKTHAEPGYVPMLIIADAVAENGLDLFDRTGAGQDRNVVQGTRLFFNGIREEPNPIDPFKQDQYASIVGIAGEAAPPAHMYEAQVSARDGLLQALVPRVDISNVSGYYVNPQGEAVQVKGVSISPTGAVYAGTDPTLFNRQDPLVKMQVAGDDGRIEVSLLSPYGVAIAARSVPFIETSGFNPSSGRQGTLGCGQTFYSLLKHGEMVFGFTDDGRTGLMPDPLLDRTGYFTAAVLLAPDSQAALAPLVSQAASGAHIVLPTQAPNSGEQPQAQQPQPQAVQQSLFQGPDVSWCQSEPFAYSSLNDIPYIGDFRVSARKYADKYGIPYEYLLYSGIAIANTESHLHHYDEAGNVLNRGYGVGIMQLVGRPGYIANDPASNIDSGMEELAMRINAMGSLAAAAGAYNGGQAGFSEVIRLLDGENWMENAEMAASIKVSHYDTPHPLYGGLTLNQYYVSRGLPPKEQVSMCAAEKTAATARQVQGLPGTR